MSSSTSAKLFKVIIPLLLFVVSTLGIVDAGYITYEKVTGRVPKCSAHFQCETVLRSRWASIGPIPLSALGLVYYSTLWLLSLGLYFGHEKLSLPATVRLPTRRLMLLLSTCGIFFSAYLVFVMGVILQAWCLYCLFSATFSTLLFLINLFSDVGYSKENVVPSSLRRSFFRAFYHWLVKPICFKIDAETVHNSITQVGKFLGSTVVTRTLVEVVFDKPRKHSPVQLNDISFPNPIGLSAGFDYNGELTQILPAVGFGFTTVGTVTLEAYTGNPKPRLSRYPDSKALLVNKGFKSLGAKAIIHKLEKLNFSVPVGISIGSTNKIFASLSQQIRDITHTFRLFEASTVSHQFYELNISCPNTQGGQPFTTAHRLEKLLQSIDTLYLPKPVYIKMPIDLKDQQTLKLLTIASTHRIAGVIFGNLTKDRANPDVKPDDRMRWLASRGNLSGKPTWNRSNHCIELTKKTFGDRFTIIGTGGIFTSEDALKKIELGADLVQLITGMIYEGPQLINEIHSAFVHQKKLL